MLVSTLPKCKQQRADTLPFLYIEEVIVRIERVERYRTFIGIGKIHTILALSLAVDKFTQFLIIVRCQMKVHNLPLNLIWGLVI